jgi:hypothetical protein
MQSEVTLRNHVKYFEVLAAAGAGIFGRADWNMLECIKFPWHRAPELTVVASAILLRNCCSVEPRPLQKPLQV